MFRIFRRLIFALPLCLLAGACDVNVGDKGVSVNVASERAGDTWQRSYAFASGGRLELTVANGAVNVTGTSGSEAQVTVVRNAAAMTKEHAQEAVESVEIVETAKPDLVRIDIRQGDQDYRRRVEVRATVAVPRGLTASIRTQNGRIELENVDGKITVAVANGPITGKGVSGNLSASAVNGRLSLDLSPSVGDIELTSLNGAIRVGIPPETNADLQLDALNGGVSVDPRLNLVSTAKPPAGSGGDFFTNRITGRLNAGGPRIVAHATNGAVRFGLPGDDPGGRAGRQGQGPEADGR
jgi:hypothetical protein